MGLLPDLRVFRLCGIRKETCARDLDFRRNDSALQSSLSRSFRSRELDGHKLVYRWNPCRQRIHFVADVGETRALETAN